MSGMTMSGQPPDPRLRKVYRLEVTLGEPLDLGEIARGHRRIVPQTGGTFTGPEISGKLLWGAVAPRCSPGSGAERSHKDLP